MQITEEAVYELAPYAKTLGVHFATIAPDQVIAQLDFDDSLSTVGGGLHGGALMALADVAAAVVATAAANGLLPATTESSTHFLEPVRGRATATAVPLRVGRSQVLVDIKVRNDDGVLCVQTIQTVALIRPTS